MIDLIFPGRTYDDLKAVLLQSDLETAAILFAKVADHSDGFRLLVNKIRHPDDQAYRVRTGQSAQLQPEYIAPIVKQAKARGEALCFVHTHPGSRTQPHFSQIDNEGEKVIARFLSNRGADAPHTALLIGHCGCEARRIGSNEWIRVIQIGQNLDIVFDPLESTFEAESFDRQVRAFGIAGQKKLRRIKVGIVGLGGTGSVIAQQLAYLGLEKFLLIDPDKVDETNLNRVVGTTMRDIGAAKIDVAANYIRTIRPSASIILNSGTVLDAKTARRLIDTDFIFCCTDTHGSRAVLNQLSYQYYLPCIDMGVSITTKAGTITHITGRVQMLAPGLSCLICGNLLDSEAVRLDLMTKEQRLFERYIIGEPQPQPAVMSLNSTVVSLAITMFLGAITGIPVHARYQIYNGITGAVRPVAGVRDPLCISCSKNGALGRGDEWPLPARL